MKKSPFLKVADNRKARFNYNIEDTWEAGLSLLGSEVKSARKGQATIHEAYASFYDTSLCLINSHIPEYFQANRFNHNPRRPRTLLMHKKEIKRITGLIERKGYTLVPLSLYFNERGWLKVQLGLGTGKKDYDKRETIRRREWDREKQRVLKNHGS